MLYIFTVTINLIALSVAIWLGTYIVTRSPRSPVAWLAGLTLWLMAGPFLNVLLALSLPPSPNFVPPWVVPLLWFWPPGVFEHGQSAWLEGWQATLAFTTWHHLSVLLRYGRMNVLRWIRVIAGYVVAFVLILAQRYTGQIYISLNGDPLTLSTLLPGPLHPVYVASLLFFGVYSIVNLANSARQAPSRVERRQLNSMLVAHRSWA
jgi:hypothetical protein